MAVTTLGSTLSAEATPFYPNNIPPASATQKRRPRKRPGGDRQEGGNGTEQTRRRVQEISHKFRVLTWNCQKLNANTEIVLRTILEDNAVDVAAITETEIEDNSLKIFLPGYKTFYPLNPNGFTRVLLFVRDSLDINEVSIPESSGLPVVMTVVQDITIVAIYRQFCEAGSKDASKKGGAFQTGQLEDIINLLKVMGDISPKLIVAGDINLDMARIDDSEYYNSFRLRTWLQAI